MRSHIERPSFTITAILAGSASAILLIAASVLVLESLFPRDGEESIRLVLIFTGILAAITVIFMAWITGHKWKLLAVSIVAMFGVAISAVFTGRFLTMNPDTFAQDAVLILVNVSIFITIAAVYGQVRGSGKSFTSVMILPEPKRLFLLPALLWGASLLLIIGVVSLLPEYLRPISNTSDALERVGQSLPLAIVIVGILTPIGEEIFFRGFLLRMLSTKFTGKISIVLSSALFALFHIDYRLFIPIFILSLALGLAFIWTQSIWPPIIIHMAQNITGLIIATQELPLQ